MEQLKEIKKLDYHQLLESIDFFSQNLSFEQIISYGYYFVHNMLELDSSAIYVLEGNDFVLKEQMNAEFQYRSFPDNDRIRRIATKFGRVLQKELTLYFDQEHLESEQIEIAIPLLVKDKTVALIFSKNKQIDLSDENLALFFNGINQLLNKASESAKNFEQYKEASTALDRKIFSLLFINHSTKALMSEIDIHKLYYLCVDVIRELTASAVTSFGLYDSVRDTIVLRGYKDILSFDDYYCELKLFSKKAKRTQVIYDIERDYELLKELFVNAEEFIRLKAKYVVLLVKDEIMGFVTIGETISQKPYTTELLEQTESLISSIYIAISNAQYVQMIKSQKEEISEQLLSLGELNKAIKNINTCDSIEELCHLTIQTLTYGFGIEKSMVVLKGKNGFYIEAFGGFDLDINRFEYTPLFAEQCFDQTVFDPITNADEKYLDKDFVREIGLTNCFVSVPLDTGEFGLNASPEGFLMIFKTTKALQKNQVIVLETLANSIVPTIKQIKKKQFIEEHYIPNYEREFLDVLERAIENRNDYYTDFSVNFKVIITRPFDVIDLEPYKELEVFYFSGIILHISYNEEFDDGIFDGKLDAFSVDEFKNELKELI